MKKKAAVLALLIMLTAIALLCVSCTSKSYNLNRDKSLSTNWGDTLQFRIDSNWSTDSPDYNSDFSKSMYFYNSDENLALSITAENTTRSSYKYSSTKTYGDWIDWTESLFSRSAANQADEYKQTHSKDDEDYDPEYASPDNYCDFTDCSITELASENNNGNNFKIYKLNYKASYSDAAYANLKNKWPDLEREYENERYYALVKDGTHDLEISTDDEGMLRAFLKTLTIDW